MFVAMKKDGADNGYYMADAEEQMPMTSIERNLRNNQTVPEECGCPDAVVNGIMFFEKLPADAGVREIADVMVSFRRLSAIAHEDGSWEPVNSRDMDWSYHITREPAISSKASMCETIDRIGAQQIDLAKPPWKMHVIPSSAPKEHSAILVRVQHCVGDGVHMAQILQAMATRADGTHPPNEALKKYEAMRAQKGCAKLGKQICMCCGVVPGLVASLAASKQSYESESVWHIPLEARREADFTGPRAVIMIPPHSLEFIKECKDAAGVTVNDILQAATAGAIRRYCEMRGDPLFVAGEDCSVVFRALVPVALPKSFPPDHDEKDRLVNNFCFCSVTLPVGAAGALERIDATSREMDKLKNSMRAPMALFIADKIGPNLPLSAIQDVAKDLFCTHGLVFSNVPGPQEELFVAGEKVAGFQVVYYNPVPQVIVTSYNGKVFFTMTVNSQIMQNREWFVQCYFDELREIGRELGVTADLAVDI